MQSKIATKKSILEKPEKVIRDEEVEKYLTEMKELGEVGDQPSIKITKKSNVADQSLRTNKETEKVEEVGKSTQTLPSDHVDSKTNLVSFAPADTRPYTKVDLILLIVNFIALGTLFFLLAQIPNRVKDLKEANLEIQKLSESPGITDAQLTKSKQIYEEIASSFLDKTTIVNFVNDIEKIKSEGTTISKVTFSSQTPVKDKTGNYGYPVIIELNGAWDRISQDLYDIEKLPYLFKPARLESERNPKDDVILLRYGGILYVKDLGKN